MRLKSVEIIKRDQGFFWLPNGSKVKAVYPRRGFAVMVFLEDSPIDLDFKAKVWVPRARELQRIKEALDKSDRLTHELLGRGWGYGDRPYLKVADFL